MVPPHASASRDRSSKLWLDQAVLAAAAAPALYTAIQEQIGLKLEAVKAPADILVIDRIEKPSDI